MNEVISNTFISKLIFLANEIKDFVPTNHVVYIHVLFDFRYFF